MTPSSVKASAPFVVEKDRGLGTAYERYCFYQRLDAWAKAFEVETFLEGPLDGMAGIPSVYGAVLARRGVKVTAAVPSEEHAKVTRAVYEGVSAPASVVVTDPSQVATLPPSDMVLCYHAFGFVDDWRAYVASVAALAKKVLVVAVCNPDNWGVAFTRGLARVRGAGVVDPPESWKTNVLGPELWKHGRVKEHAYFDCPWWPDLPVSPGQSLADRLKKLAFSRKETFRRVESLDEASAAKKFVYDGARWPYFGGPGWVDDLMPGLLKHPSFEAASPKVQAKTAHLHAFVVDMRPRTPRERRRLAQV